MKYNAKRYAAPAFARLVSELKIERAAAINVRRIIRGTMDPASVPAVQQWIDQCYSRPSDLELRIAAINALIDCHGVEALPVHLSGAHPSAVYCNAGDTYAATILYCYDSDRFLLTSWGDYVERYERRHGRSIDD